MKATEHHFHVALFNMLYKVVLIYELVNEILRCDHLNESYWAVPYYSIAQQSVVCLSTFIIHDIAYWALVLSHGMW